MKEKRLKIKSAKFLKRLKILNDTKFITVHHAFLCYHFKKS